MTPETTLIRARWVVAWAGTQHEIIRDGVCVIQGDSVVHVGKTYDGAYDRLIKAENGLVSPGLISTHLHAGFNARDYVFLDVNRPWSAGRNYLNWQAGLLDHERHEPDPRSSITFGLAQCLLSGITTVVEIGAGGDGNAYAAAVEETGIRSYVGLSYRNASMYSNPNGSIGYLWEDVTEKFGLALEFAERCHDGELTRLRPVLCPGHPDTCELEVLEKTAEIARERNWPVTIHTGLHFKEFERTFEMYGASPYEVLDRTGLLGPNVILGHAILHRGHSLSAYAGDDLALLGERRAVISHSPIKFAHLGIQMESLQRYNDAGVTVTVGTDFSPPDIVAEMRQAMLASRVADRSFLSGSPRLVFDAATVNAADALGRPDLGRLAKGTRADLVIFDLSELRFGAVYDPIRALVECGSGADLRWSFVDGRMVVEDGKLATVDEADLLRLAHEDGSSTWDDVPNWYPGGRSVEEIVPPAYPMR